MADGSLVPDYPIRDINQKGVYRHDLGDLDELAESLQRLGLLTPIVVTDNGDLICGKRRLAAAVRLGWDAVPAWIPGRVSDQLRLFALFDDEALRKPLTPIEQAELYAEYEHLYAQQARLRQQATRFQPDNTAASNHQANEQGDGGSESDLPFLMPLGGAGKARQQAAKAVTGSASQTRLDQIRELQAIAADSTQHPMVQQDAAEALVELDHDGVVNPRWQRVKLGQHLHTLDDTATDPDEPDTVRQAAAEAIAAVCQQPCVDDALKLARQGLKQVADIRASVPPKPRPAPDPHAEQKRQVRLLVALLRREHGWWDRNSPATFAAFADQAQWDLVESYATGVRAFHEQASSMRARHNRPGT